MYVLNTENSTFYNSFLMVVLWVLYSAGLNLIKLPCIYANSRLIPLELSSMTNVNISLLSKCCSFKCNQDVFTLRWMFRGYEICLCKTLLILKENVVTNLCEDFV